MNRTAPRKAGAVFVAVVVLALGVVRLIGASGAPPGAGFTTFAHIATGDIGAAADRQAVVDRYDLIALRGNLTASLMTDLHQRRAGVTLLAYEKAAGLNSSEVVEINATNPEWIAQDASGNDIHPQGIPDTTLGDLTNPAFRQWQASKIAVEVGLGADGAFVDTVGAYFPPDFYTGRPVIGGAAVTDTAWRDGSADLLHRIKALTGRTVVANGFGLGNGNAYFAAAADADVVIAAADGVQIENFTRSGNTPAGQFVSAARWDQDLAFLELLGARNKLALAYTKVKVPASSAQLTSLRDYALGSYLLAYAPGRAHFGFDDGGAISVVQSDATWANNLGAPTGARTRSGTDGWTRPFLGGVLTVRVGSAPVVSSAPPARLVATFTGAGRSTFPVTVGAGRVTATVTFAGGGWRSIVVYNEQNGSPGSTWGYSPVGLELSLAAGTYRYVIDGGSGPFTLRVEYPNPTPSATTTSPPTSTSTSTSSTSTTSTTRPPTTTSSSTTTRPPTTTTVAPGRQTVTFTGTGGHVMTFPVRTGAGLVTARVTFAGGGTRNIFTYSSSAAASGPSPLVLNATLAASTHTFGVYGPATGPYTLRVEFPAP